MKIVTIDIPDNKTERLFKEFASENGIKIFPVKNETVMEKEILTDKIPNAITRKAMADVDAGKTRKVKNVKDLMSKILG